MAKDSRYFTISVLRESGVVYYGDCTALFVPSEKETVVILAQHTPMIMKLGVGVVSIRGGSESQELANIKSGLLYVGDNEATVLIDL